MDTEYTALAIRWFVGRTWPLFEMLDEFSLDYDLQTMCGLRQEQEEITIW